MRESCEHVLSRFEACMLHHQHNAHHQRAIFMNPIQNTLCTKIENVRTCITRVTELRVVVGVVVVIFQYSARAQRVQLRADKLTRDRVIGSRSA